MINPSINYSKLTNAEVSWVQDGSAGNVKLTEVSAASGTASGIAVIYVKSSDSKLYFQDDSGTEFDLTTTGSGAPASAQYVVLATNATLTGERVLTGTPNQIILTDNGANSSIVLSLPQNISSTATVSFGSATIQTLTAGTVVITGGVITGITDLAIADGGTGTSTAIGARANLGMIIGTDVQAFDAQLSDIAATSPSGSAFIGSNATNLVLRTAAQTRGDLGLVIGTDVQAFDSTLTSLAAYNTNGILVQTSQDNFTGRTITGILPVSVSNGDGVSGNPVISVGTATSAQITTGTGTTTVLTPAGLSQSAYGKRILQVLMNDPNTAAGGGVNTGTAYVRIDSPLDNYRLIGLEAGIATGSALGGGISITARNITKNYDIVSTPVWVDVNESDSITSGTAVVIVSGSASVSTGDKIRLTVGGSGTARGIIASLIYQL